MRSELADIEIQIKNTKEQISAPFAKEAERKEKEAQLKELNILLNVDEKDRSLIGEVTEDEPEPVKNRECVFVR